MPTAASARDNPSVPTIAVTSLIRIRHSPVLWVSLLLPVVLGLPLAVIAVFSPEGRAGQQWEVWQHTTMLFWGMLVPILAAMYAALTARQDADALRLLFGYAIPRYRLFVGRFLALAATGLGCAALLYLVIAVPGVLTGNSSGLATLAAGLGAGWLAGLGTLALCQLLADLWGFVAAIGLGIAGSMFAALLADKSVWLFIPPAWPMRAVIPLGGFESSGLPLPPGHPLWDTGVIPVAIGLSAALSAVMCAAGGLYLNRKEL